MDSLVAIIALNSQNAIISSSILERVPNLLVVAQSFGTMKKGRNVRLIFRHSPTASASLFGKIVHPFAGQRRPKCVQCNVVVDPSMALSDSGFLKLPCCPLYELVVG